MYRHRLWYEVFCGVNGINRLCQNVETHLHNTVTHLRQFSAWPEKYYAPGFEIALKVARKFAENSNYDIPLIFKQ